MSESPSSGVQLELLVRSLAPEGAQAGHRAVIGRLGDLAERGLIDEYAVQVCGRAVPPRPGDAVTEFGTYVLNRIAVFREWAERGDRSLGSLFEVETVHSSMTDEEFDRIVLPVMTLAEYEDGALRFVSPCVSDERTWSVPGRLEYLAAAQGGDGAKQGRGAEATDPETAAQRPQSGAGAEGTEPESGTQRLPGAIAEPPDSWPSPSQ